MHRAVLLNEVMHWLAPRRGGVYVDGTLGGGGHARAIMAMAGLEGRLLALDHDAGALERVRATWGEGLDRCTLVGANFEDMEGVAGEHGVTAVDGVLLDIGVSSDQLDDPERGFSFMRDGPLDMRMDKGRRVTAADLLNTLPEEELAGLLRRYGEEPRARAIARRVARERARAPFSRTAQLRDLVMNAYGGQRGRIHPATRTFQALRIAVNGELEALERGLEAGLNLLGFPLSDVIGKPILSFVTDNQRSVIEKRMQSRLSGDRLAPYEVDIRTGTGEIVTAILQAVPIRYRKESVMLVLMTNINTISVKMLSTFNQYIFSI